MKSLMTGMAIAITLLLAQSCSSSNTNQTQSQNPGPTTSSTVNTPTPIQSANSTAKTANNRVPKPMGHEHGMSHSMAMDLGPADADYDLRFIDAMTPHHQGAVLMAKEALQKSKRPEIKKLANDIIKAQNQEIGQMKKWRKAWYPKAGDKPVAYHAEMGHTMEMSAKQMQAMMMSQDLGAADDSFDLRFIDAMIPHHEGALIMAQEAVNKSKRPEIKKLSQAILSSQQKEIDQMKQWRQAWSQP